MQASRKQNENFTMALPGFRSSNETDSSFKSHSSFNTTVESLTSEEHGDKDNSIESSLIGSDDSGYQEHLKRVEKRKISKKRERRRDIWASMRSSENARESFSPRQNPI